MKVVSAIVVPMARLWAARHRLRPVRLASLREDYLSQVQRDFLSRSAMTSRPNTPSECAPVEAGARTEVYGKPGATPSSLCSFALVVVYCSGCARSG